MRSRRFSLNSSGFKSVLKKSRFSDGSVWTVGGVTIETKLRISNSSGVVWTAPERTDRKKKTDSDLMDAIFVLSIKL